MNQQNYIDNNKITMFKKVLSLDFRLLSKTKYQFSPTHPSGWTVFV